MYDRVLIAQSGLADRPRKSRWPARLDLLQSGTGLILALFMWGHMFFVASILWSPEAMWVVTRLFEGYFFLGDSHYWLVSCIAGLIALIFFLHALTALRKLPGSYRQWRVIRAHVSAMRHGDSTLWLIQAVTGFLLFFLASAHLYQMFNWPQDIGPYASADRMWSDKLGAYYLLMLFVVELHGGIGLYRLAVKWLSWSDHTRVTLKRLKWGLTAFFLVLGLLTWGAYMKLGYEHQASYGERYTPEWVSQDYPEPQQETAP